MTTKYRVTIEFDTPEEAVSFLNSLSDNIEASEIETATDDSLS